MASATPSRRETYLLDLLDPERRESWERAASRNGERLSAWIRRHMDAVAERRPLEPSLDPSPVEDLDPCLHRVFRVEVLAWGGRRCGGCGELL